MVRVACAHAEAGAWRTYKQPARQNTLDGQERAGWGRGLSVLGLPEPMAATQRLRRLPACQLRPWRVRCATLAITMRAPNSQAAHRWPSLRKFGAPGRPTTVRLGPPSVTLPRRHTHPDCRCRPHPSVNSSYRQWVDSGCRLTWDCNDCRGPLTRWRSILSSAHLLLTERHRCRARFSAVLAPARVPLSSTIVLWNSSRGCVPTLRCEHH